MLKIINRFFIKLFLMSACGLFLSNQMAQAQIAEDALLMGRLQTTGTARLQGLGGTGYALGGDVTTAYLNPAGLGFYNRSSVVFTPTFSYVGTNTNYEGASADAFNTRFNISNFGIVFNNTKDEIIPSDWRGGSFAITYNTLNSYNYDYNYGPANNLGFSIIDDFVRRTNGIPVSELESNLDMDPPDILGYPEAAYDNFLINPVPGNEDTYVASIPAGATSNQEGDLMEESRLSQWNFAYGGNYKDKLYLGVSIGFRSFSYIRENEYRETYNYPQDYNPPFFPVDDQLSIDFVDYVQLNETLKIEGSGINAGLGVVYRPVEEVTMGLTYQTPTFYTLTNEEYFDLSSVVLGIQESDATNPFDQDRTVNGNRTITEYTLSTPSRIGAGLAYFFEKYGFLTADIEYVNYASNKFSTSENYSLSDVNENVDNIFKSVINYRVGGEARVDMFRFRAGYAMNVDPTQYSNDKINRDRRTISAGVGIYSPQFFADLAVSNTSYESDFSPYLGAPFYKQETGITTAMITLGFNF